MKTDKRSLGLYIHIPFCVKKCYYCDFLSAESVPAQRELYTNRLCRQIRTWGETVRKAGERYGFEYETDTVFFGGGTPSLLEPEQFGRIMRSLKDSFRIHPQAEITVECNPGTLNEARLLTFRENGVNRLSIGLQSTDERELEVLGRIHRIKDFEENYSLARRLGFSNINIDLMSGLPGQTKNNFIMSLERVISLRPEHISAYSLIIEEGTVFYDRYAEGKGLPDEETVVAMDEAVWELTKKHCYSHYEVSNYAKDGYECRHNLKYWRCDEYLGLGTGASSCMNGDCGLVPFYGGRVRFKNITSTSDYIKAADEQLIDETELDFLNNNEETEEFAFLGLRMKEGISLKRFEKRFGKSIYEVYGDVIRKYEAMGLLTADEKSVSLTAEGLEVSNQVMADFLLQDAAPGVNRSRNEE